MENRDTIIQNHNNTKSSLYSNNNSFIMLKGENAERRVFE